MELKIWVVSIPEETHDRLHNAHDVTSELSAICDWKLTREGIESEPLNERLMLRVSAVILSCGESLFSKRQLEGYRSFETTAPEEYDGFSTMTIEKVTGRTRRVAIHERDVEWQRSRYLSGIYSVREVA